MRLDAATVLLQWAAGGLFFLWVTTRRREVGLGYGWLLRGVYFAMAAATAVALAAGDVNGAGEVVRVAGAIGTSVAAVVALGVSIARRRAGVRGQRSRRAERAEQVAAMAGRAAPTRDERENEDVREFPPALDLVAAAAGLVGLLGAAAAVGGPYALSAFRLVVGALFLGALTDAMLLGHWYLVQPGLARGPIKEMVVLAAVVWPFEVAAYLWPVGMAQVLDGTVDDGFDGLLGWTWLVCAVTTIVLLGVTWLALRERYYSAVMAATGLLYLAILTGFGVDLIARAALAP
jgi:hypothetical protein